MKRKIKSTISRVTEKRGNVDNSPKQELNQGPLDLKSSTLPNELQRYPTRAVLVVVLINPNQYKRNRSVIEQYVAQSRSIESSRHLHRSINPDLDGAMVR